MNEKHIRTLIKNDEVEIVRKPRKNTAGSFIYYILGTCLSLIFIFPILYMFACSTKSQATIAQHAGTLLMFVPDFSNMDHFLDNYKVIFGDYNIFSYACNSLIYAAIIIVLNIVVNGFAAYAITKLTFPGKRFFNFIIMFLIIVPVESSIIPLYTICKTMLGLKKSLSVLAIILPSTISIFNIFLFMQFFSSIPKDYEEAARMDGANSIKIFFKLILPLSKPILATVAVFCFIGVWNDYLWPTMVLPQEQMWPIQAAITTIQSMEGITTGQIMASLVTTSIPIFIIYIAAQKYIVKGFGAGGLKM
ncbi:MAG: carbohydrate ABC transporter permease [Bacilli bacterium]|nr:carbohydrate ABC transporter permease [Bacilli bacterium]